MSDSPNLREQQKLKSRERILQAAAQHIRAEGIDGASIVPIMKQAGLTHGSFYAHFKDKEQMVNAAFVQALAKNRQLWTGNIEPEVSLGERFKRLAKRYLNIGHRDDMENGCAFGSLVCEAARSDGTFKQTFEQEIEKTLSAMLSSKENSDAARQQAIAFFAMCVGGISLSRAVNNGDFSEEILHACTAYADKIAEALPAE